MNILVTGATGFIGSHLCREIVQRGNNVFALSHSGKTGKVQQLLQDKKFQLITGDILDVDMIADIIRDNDITGVFHLAARVPNGESNDDFQAFFDTNTLGTFNMLRAAYRNNIENFVYASSISVYSAPPQYLPVNESHSVSPQTPYGITKLAGELMCNMFSDRMCLIILRYGGVYGKYQYERDVTSIFLRQTLHNIPITIYGDGSQSSDFVYIDDVVSGTLLAWEKRESGIFNIGSGEETRIIDLAHKIKRITGSESEIILSGDNTERPFRFVLDIEKSRKILGWSPCSLDERLPQYIEELKAEV